MKGINWIPIGVLSLLLLFGPLFRLVILLLAVIWTAVTMLAEWLSSGVGPFIDQVYAGLVSLPAAVGSVALPSIPPIVVAVAMLAFGLIGMYAVRQSQNETSVVDRDPLDEIEEPPAAPFRGIKSYGEFKRVERTPAMLSQSASKCTTCGRISSEAYRIDRYVDHVAAGFTADSEHKSTKYECVACDASDPIDVSLGTAPHMVEAHPERSERYELAYRRWADERRERIDEHIHNLHDAKQARSNRQAASHDPIGKLIAGVLYTSRPRDIETIGEHIMELDEEKSRMNQRSVPEPFKEWDDSLPDSEDDDSEEEEEDEDETGNTRGNIVVGCNTEDSDGESGGEFPSWFSSEDSGGNDSGTDLADLKARSEEIVGNLPFAGRIEYSPVLEPAIWGSRTCGWTTMSHGQPTIRTHTVADSAAVEAEEEPDAEELAKKIEAYRNRFASDTDEDSADESPRVIHNTDLDRRADEVYQYWLRNK